MIHYLKLDPLFEIGPITQRDTYVHCLSHSFLVINFSLIYSVHIMKDEKRTG